MISPNHGTIRRPIDDWCASVDLAVLVSPAGPEMCAIRAEKLRCPDHPAPLSAGAAAQPDDQT